MAPGTTGWATRFVDVVYAGCIPVFISSTTHYPFEDIIDYETFSIHISENHLDKLEEKLSTYTDADLLIKQRYLLKVRTAFLFNNYDSATHNLRDLNNPLCLSY